MRPALALVLLLSLAAGLFFMLLGDETPGETIASSPALAEVSSDEASSPSLAEDAPTRQAAGEPAREPLAPDPYPWLTPSVPEETGPGWILRLDLRGPPVDGPVEVTIRARPVGDPFAGQARVDVTAHPGLVHISTLDPLLVDGVSLDALVIEARHPELVAQTLNVALPKPVAKDGTRPDDVEVLLELGRAARLTGTVTDSGGAGVPARVGLWRFAGAGVGGEVEAETNADADGRFQFQLPDEGEVLLVAATPTHLPAWQRVVLVPGGMDLDLGTLVVGDGAQVEGRFTVGGDEPPYPVSFQLQREAQGAQLYWDWMSFMPSPGTMLWTGQHVERFSNQALASKDGYFRVEGLEPGHHDLQLHGFNEGHGRMSREPFGVTAPAQGLHFELGWSRIAVKLALEEPGKPLRAAKLVLERLGKDTERSDLFGGELEGTAVREFVFDAGEPLVFLLELEGLEPLRHELRAPPAGERIEVLFEVPDLGNDARLLLRLEEGAFSEGASFIVHVVSTASAPVPADLGLVGGGDHQVSVEGGALVLEDLPPGPAYVLAYPGSYAGQRASMLLDASVEVQLVAGALAVADLQFLSAGRLQVGKRDGDDGWSWAACQIADPNGDPVEATFVSYAPDGGGGASARGALPDLGPSEVVPNLRPGRYTVTVDGESREVEVEAGLKTVVIFK